MANGMRFVVGSAGGGEEGNPNFDLGHELDLVKAALLYADRVELVSAGSSLLYGFVTLSGVPPAERLAVVRRHAPTNAGFRLPEEQLEKMDLIMAGGPDVRQALGERRLAEVQGQLQAVVDQGWDEIKQDVERRFEAYNAKGLEDAVRSGLLDLHTFEGHTLDGMLSMAAEGFTVEAAVDDILWEYVGRAQIAMDGDGYPLFDDLIGRLVNEAVRNGLIDPSPGAVHRGRHGGLSGDLLPRLPLFEEATVAEVLDIRRELEAPLAGFRGAVSDFSAQIRSAAWEPGFAGEADVLFRETVEPEVDRIEDEIRENRSLAELARRVLRHGGVTRPALGAAIGHASDLSALSGIVLGLGASAVQALLDERDRRREIEDNRLFFYYAAREMSTDSRQPTPS